jgi:hypothetical protein
MDNLENIFNKKNKLDNQKILIGLTGKKSSGKSTVANYLEVQWLFKQLAFADPLKKGLIEIFGIDDLSFYGTEYDKNKIDSYWKSSGRELMQLIGSEIFRDYLPKILPQLHNIWVRRMEKNLIELNNSYIVISDCRFKEEADLIHKYGGIIINIQRDNLESTDLHQSETQYIKPDYVLENNNNINKFYKSIDQLIIHIMEQKII